MSHRGSLPLFFWDASGLQKRKENGSLKHEMLPVASRSLKYIASLAGASLPGPRTPLRKALHTIPSSGLRGVPLSPCWILTNNNNNNRPRRDANISSSIVSSVLLFVRDSVLWFSYRYYSCMPFASKKAGGILWSAG